MEMTPEQMSKMVLTKYNDTVNKGESHRIDLFSTAPYVIRTDGYDAVEVIFPGLVPGRKYRVAMGDYVSRITGDSNIRTARLRSGSCPTY